MMKSLIITTFKDDEPTPEVTISIPSNVFKIANQLIPKKAFDALSEHGIDLSSISGLLNEDEASGVIVEIEDHRKHEKTVFSIE